MERTGIQVRDEDITALTKLVDSGSHSGLLRLKLVPQEFIAEYWLSVQPFIKLAMDRTDEATDEDLIDMLLEGDAQLLVEFLEEVPQGCVVTCVVNYPRIKALEILAIAGFPTKRRLYPNKDSFALLQQYARILGCGRIQGYANEAIARLWRRIGFKQLSIKVGIDL